MCVLFDKNNVYKTPEIATKVYETFPDRYCSLTSCLTSISNKATRLEKMGLIRSINNQKKNRIYSGIDAQKIVDLISASATIVSKASSTIEQPKIIAEDYDFSGWLIPRNYRNGSAHQTPNSILITVQKSGGRERACFSFSSNAKKVIFAEKERASLYISRKSSKLLLVAGEVYGVPSWKLTKVDSKYKFSVTLQEPYAEIVKKFVGDYDLDNLSQTGISTPDGGSIKAWCF